MEAGRERLGAVTFRLFFLGAEQPTHVRLMQASGVDAMGLSFWSLSKRLPKRKAWLVADRLPEDAHVFIDGGGHSANKSMASVSEWEEYAATYRSFVEANIEAVEMVSEFDCLALGPRWIADQRRDFYDHLPRAKFLPVWHARYGVDELERLSREYDRVGIPEDALEEITNLAVRVNTLEARYGTEFHAVSSGKPDDLRSVRFSSAATSSWLSPMKYGETIVWDGTKLHRYPAKYKEQARTRHRMLFARAGFDADAIVADDPTEVARFTLWSFKQLEAHVDRRRPPALQLADSTTESSEEPFADLPPDDADNTPVPVRKNSATPPRRREASERRNLPVFGFEQVTTTEVDEDGAQVIGERLVPRLGNETIRQCDTCYVAASCPARQPGAECAFNLPVSVQTKDQLRSLLNAVMEMQGQRVAFARFAEELNGGYPDPNVSQEIDRLFKLVESVKRLEDNREFARISVETRGQSGLISQLFGEKAKSLRELPNGGLDADRTNRVISQALED